MENKSIRQTILSLITDRGITKNDLIFKLQPEVKKRTIISYVFNLKAESKIICKKKMLFPAPPGYKYVKRVPKKKKKVERDYLDARDFRGEGEYVAFKM